MPTAKPSGWYRSLLFAMLAGSLLFVVAGVALSFTGTDGSLAATVFFGLCAVIFIWQLRPDLFESETRSVEALLAQFPGPVVLRASVRKILFLAVVSVVFGGVCLWMLRHDAIPAILQVLMWPGIVLFLGSSPVLILIAILGSSLHLDGEGAVMEQIRRSRRMRWQDMSGFAVAAVAGTTRLVVFDHAAAGNSRLATVNRRLTGRSPALPDTYGLAPDDLAGLLAAWRARACEGAGIPV